MRVSIFGKNERFQIPNSGEPRVGDWEVDRRFTAAVGFRIPDEKRIGRSVVRRINFELIHAIAYMQTTIRNPESGIWNQRLASAIHSMTASDQPPIHQNPDVKTDRNLKSGIWNLESFCF